MTVLCGGGTSSPKPGVASQIQLKLSAILQLVQQAQLNWLVQFLDGYASKLINTSVICVTDPPAAPVFNPDDLVAIAWPLNDFAATGTALAKVDQLIQRLAWFAFCQCDSVPTPALPTPVTSQPSGAPAVIDATVGLCVPILRSQTRVLNLWNGVTNVPPPANWDQPTFNDASWPLSSVPHQSSPTLAGTVGGYGISPRCIDGLGCMYQPIAPWTAPTSGAEEFLVRWQFELPTFDYTKLCVALDSDYQAGVGAGGWSTGNFSVNGTAGGPVFNSINWQGAVSNFKVGPNLLALWINSGNAAGANTWGNIGWIGVKLAIAGAIAAPSTQGCCPPDPTQLQLLQSILQAVTLIQRQSVPFGYRLGTVHSGLTGSGEITIQGLLGAKVVPSLIPGNYGVVSGDPDTLWLDSWINWGNADGWHVREFLRTSPHLSFPQLAGQYTKLGYTLAPGLTVNITELLREV